MPAKVGIVHLLKNEPYSGSGKFGNLANKHNFAKLKQSKCNMHFT